MRRNSRFVSLLSVLFFLLVTFATAFAAVHTSATPKVRVTAKIDISKRATLPGHVPSALRRATDQGRIAPSTSAPHMIMVLKPSDEQKHELRRVLDEQQDKRTANYHQWVTPEEFGAHFGVSDADIAKVSDWLTSQGFKVEEVSKSKRVLRFSGTTGNIEKAFQTEMHSYQVGGVNHVSNNSEISVPKALSPVISGVSLHNFFRKAKMGPVHTLRELKTSPNYSANSTTHYVSPQDFATIYNTTPLLNAGINGSGSSIAIVGRSDILMSDVQTYRQMFGLPVNDPIFIHAGQDNGTQPGDDGESDLDVEISGGVAPNAQVYFVIGTPTFLVDGITNSIEYIVENNLADIMSISYGSCESLEGTGGNEFNLQAFEQAAAQGISVFVAAGDNGPAECDDSNDSYEVLGYATGGEASTPYNVSVGGAQFGGDTSTAYATYWTSTNNSNFSSALGYIPEYPWNEAKGADKTLTAAASLGGLWSGSGGISAYYIQPAWQFGSGVPASDPALAGGNWVTGVTFTNGGGAGYVTAPTVTFTGGGCTAEPTATTTISGGSVSGIVFNYGTQGGTLHTGQGIGCTSAPTVAFGAAPTGGTTATGTATIGAPQNIAPLVAGVPHRFTPDLSLNAASAHDATFYCSEGVCEYNTTTGALEDAGLVGGTSVAAPSMAGIQALINQANGGRQGVPNYIYYSLANAESAALCNSSLPPLAASDCAFQDITVGDNLVCGTATCTATTGTKIGFQAAAGYDMASGLGSVNAANMSAKWAGVVFNSSDTTLSLSQTSGVAQGSSVTFSGTVAAGAGGGTPTGDVAFILSQGAFASTVDVSGDANNGGWNNQAPFATLSGGNYSATLSNLPAGTYTVSARYAGDETYASSLSTPVTVTVGSGNDTVTITPQVINQSTCNMTNGNTFTYGQLIWTDVLVASNTGAGVPTGTVTITVDGNAYATETLDPNGNGYLVAGAVPTSSCLYDYIFAQSPTLPGGTHLIGASYSGDATFSPATATPVSITVTPLSVTPTLAAGATLISAGTADEFTATFTTAALTGTSTQSSGPTGTVTFTDTTTSTVLGTANVVPTVSFSGNTYTFAATAVFNTTAITATGANAITASYSGDTNFSAATSAAVTVTVGTGTATTTTVTSNGNPTTLNGRPTFTATLTGGPTSGTVTFYDGTTVLGTGTVGAAHTATFRPASGAAFWGGMHNITASFGGTGTYLASTSPVFVETVTKGTTTIILDGKIQGTAGQAFTFAAVLTPSQTNATYAPNQGSVQFFDGATLIGSGVPITVTSGQNGYGLWTATVAVPALSPGTHTITAQYSDVNYASATSNALTVTVAGMTWATPAAITYGTPLSGTQLNATATVAGSFNYNPPAGTLLTAGTHTLSVTFTPTDTTHYNTLTASVQIQVNQATPTVTWATPAAIAYPTALSGTQLDATATGAAGALAGNFNYTPAAGTVLDAGTQTLSVLFTPTDTTDYTTATQTTSLQVNAAGQTITFPNPGPVTFGVAPITLAATSSSGLPITYTVISGPATISITHGVGTAAKGRARSNAKGAKPADSVAGSTLTITGAGTVVVEADQAGDGDYSAAVAVQDSIVVNQATPTVAWATPAAISYGTPLSGAQLNATASVPGTFTYNPPAGSVLDAGTQTLSVTFTPTDAADYSSQTGSVQIQVNQTGQTITFPNPGTQTFGVAPITLTAYSDSGLPITYTVISGPATISVTHGVGAAAKVRSNRKGAKPADSVVGSTLTITGAGTVVVEADQGGDNDYMAAAAVQDSIIVNQATPTVTWATPAAITYPAALSGTQLNATANGVAGALAGNFNYTPAAGTVLDAGTQTLSVTFTPTDTTDYNSQTGSVQLQVNQAGQTITFPNPGTQTFGVAPITLTAYSNSGLPITYTVISGPATVSLNQGAEAPANGRAHSNAKGAKPAIRIVGVTLTITGAGTVIVEADQGGDVDYLAAAPVQVSFTVNPEGQTINFTNPGDQTYGTPLNLVATATSGLPVSFTSTTPIFCTVSGTTVTMLNSGSCTIYALQAGNASWTAAAPVAQSFTIHHELQTLTFPVIPAQLLSEGSLTLSASASSGLPVTFASSTPAVCTVSGTTATLNAAGTCTITATQAGNGGWAAVAQPRSFVVQLPSQTISFSNPGDQTYGTPLSLVASASSGLPVSFASTSPIFCTVSGTTATMLNSGVCTIQATQAGNGSFAAATPVSQSFTVHHELQTLTFPVIPAQLLSTGSITLSASASSGLPVTFASSTPVVCTVSGNTATLNAAGTCTITATQAGNGDWAAAAAPRSFAVQLPTQSISFSPLSDLTLGVGPGTETLSATAISGLPVSFASTTTAICTVSGNTVTPINSGVCTVQATQAGNSNWAAATPVSQSFTTHHEAQTVTFAVIPTQSLSVDAGSLTLHATASSGLAVTFTSSTPAVCTVSGNTATLLTTGTCSILATQAGNGVYAAAAQPRSFTIVP